MAALHPFMQRAETNTMGPHLPFPLRGVRPDLPFSYCLRRPFAAVDPSDEMLRRGPVIVDFRCKCEVL